MEKKNQNAQIAIYQDVGGGQKIRVRIEEENVWLTQKLIAELFNVDVRTVNEHLQNIIFTQFWQLLVMVRNIAVCSKTVNRYISKERIC
jgi:hypothetical protein